MCASELEPAHYMLARIPFGFLPGNTYLDLVLCLLVPLLLKHLVPFFMALPSKFYIQKERKTYTRTITFTQRSGYYW